VELALVDAEEEGNRESGGACVSVNPSANSAKLTSELDVELDTELVDRDEPLAFCSFLLFSSAFKTATEGKSLIGLF
jgi:hypothetical protein